MANAEREPVDVTQDVDVKTGEIVPLDTTEREGMVIPAEALQEEHQDVGDDQMSAYRAIVNQILNAETIEEVLTPIEAHSAKEVIDRNLTLHDFHINRSEFDVGAPYYMSLDCVDEDTGEKMVVNTGHQAMMAQLIKLRQDNNFPYHVRIYRAGKPNRFGNEPLRLRKWNVEGKG